ncbi:hypothetical protein [Mycoplasma simbae]|uniref:hypothetical protein n=1 Tax=Mycoplasma simbae TaxID=36744 RepID=UPI0012EC9786|nr:hypothetical protein [Mycoplasma simbae]
MLYKEIVYEKISSTKHTEVEQLRFDINNSSNGSDYNFEISLSELKYYLDVLLNYIFYLSSDYLELSQYTSINSIIKNHPRIQPYLKYISKLRQIYKKYVINNHNWELVSTFDEVANENS